MPFTPDPTPQTSAVAPAPSEQPQTSFLGSIVKSVADPFIKTGKNIGGAAFELGRLGASKAGFNPYVKESGEEISNPFLNRQELEEASQPLSFKKGGALDKQLRSSVNIGSYAVPFGKGANVLTKTLAPGFAVGAMQGLSDENATAGSVLTSGGLGALGAGLIGKIAGAGKAAKGAGRSLKTGVIKPKVSASPFMAEEEAKIVDVLTDLGVGGSASTQKQQLPKVFRQLSDQIESMLAKDSTKVSKSKISKIVEDALESSINYDSTIPAHVSAKEKYVNQIIKQAEKDGISGKALYKAKQNLGNQLGRAFDKLEKGVPLTEKEEIAMTVWGALDDLMPNSIKELTRKQSMLYKAAPGIQKSAANPGGISVLGNKVPFSGEAGQALKYKLGSGLESAGAMSPEIPEVLQKVLKSGAARTPGVLSSSLDTDVTTSTESNPLLDSVNLGAAGVPTAQESLESIEETTSTGDEITVEQVQAVLMSPDISNATKQSIIDAFELQQKYSATAPKKPRSAAQLQVEGKARSGLQAADVIEKLVKQDPNIMARSQVPNISLLKGQDRKLYEAAISSITDAIGGLRTGASVSKEQQAFYANMLPAPGDDPATIQAKLNAVRDELSGYLGQEVGEAQEF